MSSGQSQSAGSLTRLGGQMSSRDADGQLVIRAHPLPERIVIDGRLDEPIYSQFQPASGFVQVEPRHNEPATEQTQLWIFFDERAIYIGLRCFDSAPERWSSLDKRRDSSGFGQGESVSVSLDTFHDRRNGFSFGINPAGGISDGAITNERDNNRDWNTIWDSRAARFDGRLGGRDGDSRSARCDMPQASRSGASTFAGRCNGKMRCRISIRSR